MPVPQEIHSLVKQASCLFLIVSNRQDACSTRNSLFSETGILPVPKQVIENGAKCEFKLASSQEPQSF
ncbi:MAG: hypothetical protein JGK28_04785 [Microcoleus sp. PH2017_07_MST_O_A]|nr:hypothetical protein [Microcoleus sp. PH2017_07_MST_O_A]